MDEKFYILFPEYSDYPDEAKGSDELDAARRWAANFERETAGEYGITKDGQSISVWVLTEEKFLKARSEIEIWDNLVSPDTARPEYKDYGCEVDITGEYIEQYYAKRIKR